MSPTAVGPTLLEETGAHRGVAGLSAGKTMEAVESQTDRLVGCSEKCRVDLGLLAFENGV